METWWINWRLSAILLNLYWKFSWNIICLHLIPWNDYYCHYCGQVRAAEITANAAKNDAQMAYDVAMEAKNESETNRAELEDLLNRITQFLGQAGASPTEIRTVSLGRMGRFILVAVAGTTVPSWYPVMYLNLCNWFEDWGPVDEIWSCNELWWLLT